MQPLRHELHEQASVLQVAVGTDIHIWPDQDGASFARPDPVSLGQFAQLIWNSVVVVEARHGVIRQHNATDLITVARFHFLRDIMCECTISVTCRPWNEKQGETRVPEDVKQSLPWFDEELGVRSA